jgi:hypothetical protein
MSINNIKEKKTTGIGIMLWVMALLYWVLPYFIERELWEVNQIYTATMIGLGIGFLVAPDRLLDFLFGWLKKKS